MALVYLHHASIESTNQKGLTPLCVTANCGHSILADVSSSKHLQNFSYL